MNPSRICFYMIAKCVGTPSFKSDVLLVACCMVAILSKKEEPHAIFYIARVLLFTWCPRHGSVAQIQFKANYPKPSPWLPSEDEPAL